MAENDAPKQTEDEAPTLVVPSHSPLPPPPEVHYTRPLPGAKSSAGSGQAPTGGSQNPSSGSPEPVNHGAGMAAGLTFVTSVVAGLLAGGWLDQRYIHGTTPWGTLGMTIVGTAVGFTNMFRLLSPKNRRKP